MANSCCLLILFCKKLSEALTYLLCPPNKEISVTKKLESEDVNFIILFLSSFSPTGPLGVPHYRAELSAWFLGSTLQDLVI